jgi:glutamate-1-semialdehyde aminotransferase
MELGGIRHTKPRVFLSSTTHGAEIPQLAALVRVLDIVEADPGIFARNWEKGRAIRERLMTVVRANNLENVIEFVGEDCLFAVNLKNSGIHKANVAKTFLLQELVRRGQLFQGLFYPTPAHDDAAVSSTISAWSETLPVFSKFITGGERTELIGDAIKPVFRAFNSCECTSASDCEQCLTRLEG